jgi:hypothetical protein
MVHAAVDNITVLNAVPVLFFPAAVACFTAPQQLTPHLDHQGVSTGILENSSHAPEEIGCVSIGPGTAIEEYCFHINLTF